jgi:hypothetical protein
MKKYLIILNVLTLFGCSDNGLRPRQAAPTEPSDGICYLYMASGGDDGNEGTAAKPLATLQGVQAHLELTRPNSDVIVRIASNKGPCLDQSVMWTYGNARDSLSADYNLSFESWPAELHACFVGTAADTNFFTLDRQANRPTNVHFRRLTVRGYRTGAIWFCGDRYHGGSGWNGFNSIEDCTFADIGNKDEPDKLGSYAVLDFMNSRDNVIRHCTFLNCSNYYDTGFPQLQAPANVSNDFTIHAIYLAHHSVHNLIIENTFSSIKGDVVRIRDRSDRTEICYNSFYKSGWSATVTMWYCHPAYGMYGYCEPFDECPSYFTDIHDNYFEGNWECGEPLLFQDLRVAEKENCEHPIDEYRAQLWNNATFACGSDGNAYDPSKGRPVKE